MKASVFIAISLDGFIARENGAIDWLPMGDPDGSGIPLFGPLEADIQLWHTQTRSFASGLVQSRYGVGGDPSQAGRRWLLTRGGANPCCFVQ